MVLLILVWAAKSSIRLAWGAEKRGDGGSSPSTCSWWPVQPPEVTGLCWQTELTKEGGNVPRQQSCNYLPRHTFLNWKAFPVGNACRDSYRSTINPHRPPWVCLCTWVHVHTHISCPKGSILLCSCTEGSDVTRTACRPYSFLCSGSPTKGSISVLVSWTLPEGFHSGLSLLIILQRVAFTPRKARPWKPGTTQSEAPCTPAHPQCCFCPSPGHSTTKHRDCVHPAPSDSSHQCEGHNSMDKISTAALPASLSEEVMQSRMRQQSSFSNQLHTWLC